MFTRNSQDKLQWMQPTRLIPYYSSYPFINYCLWTQSYKEEEEDGGGGVDRGIIILYLHIVLVMHVFKLYSSNGNKEFGGTVNDS